MLSMYGIEVTPVNTAWVTSVILPWSCQKFGEKLLIQSVAKQINHVRRNMSIRIVPESSGESETNRGDRPERQ